MIEAHWSLFLVASLAVIATPGQDMLLVMSRSLTHGTRAGLATAAGVSLGLVGHTVLATLGLGALLRASDWLFTGIKLAGAAYLLYLGVHLLRTRDAALAIGSATPGSLLRLFATGAASNLGNPKIAVFYFAFLPQFVPRPAEHPTLSIFALGLAFAALTFVIKGPVAVFAGRLSGWFRSRPEALLWLYRVSGFVMIGLAVRLALSRRAEA
ncbi:MAG: LysE family translocator [Burkholderiaceae bacterium]|nr:LysE family translocator [Burkholderiales bacterium]MCZ8107334.1 LysE family translocator [Burkholderiales bacterium]MCZ8339699.1 LysE family translocator [Burkholderiaceae bacterium]